MWPYIPICLLMICNKSVQFDENHDGTVSADELKRGLAVLGISLPEDDFNCLIKAVDRDGRGGVTYEQFARTFKGDEYVACLFCLFVLPVLLLASVV